MTKVFDAHFHIIDPCFPLVENKGYLPPSFNTDVYLERTASLGICSGVVVSGSFQGFDQSYLYHALSVLNQREFSYVGVTQLPVEISDAEIISLHEAGVRALRFNLYRGGSESLSVLKQMAERVHSLAGWHVELYVSGDSLSSIVEIVRDLPQVCIDHLGMDSQSTYSVDDLVSRGARVKASGFGRLDFDVLERIKRLYRLNPDALMFGSDLPSTRARRAFVDEDLYMLRKSLPSEAFRKITWDNGRNFYRLGFKPSFIDDQK